MIEPENTLPDPSKITLAQAWAFITFKASVAQLCEIEHRMYSIDVAVAFGGKNKGHETIQQRYWCWHKGTPRYQIEDECTKIKRQRQREEEQNAYWASLI